MQVWESPTEAEDFEPSEFEWFLSQPLEEDVSLPQPAVLSLPLCLRVLKGSSNEDFP